MDNKNPWLNDLLVSRLTAAEWDAIQEDIVESLADAWQDGYEAGRQEVK